MPRIRTIKPEFWTDETIVELEFHERLLFIGLWNFCDDQGFIEYKPKQLKMRIFPGDDVDVRRAMEALVRASLVAVFSDGEAVICQIRNWSRHQRVTNPARAKYIAADLQEHPELPDPLVSPREESRFLSGERKGRERKGREGKGGALAPPVPHQGYEPGLASTHQTSARETEIPRSWNPGTRHIAYALENGIANERLTHEALMFREHARSRGRTAVDWDAAFMTWLGKTTQNNSQSFSGARGRPTTDDRVRDGLALAQRLAADDTPPQIGAS